MDKYQTHALRRALEVLGSLVANDRLDIPSEENFRQWPAVQALQLTDEQLDALLTQYQNAAAATFLAYNVMKRRELDNGDATPDSQLRELNLAIGALESAQ